MARNLLTALEIKASTKMKLRDGDGLWLHTGKSGNRSWVFIFVRHGRRREMGLGPYGTGTGQVSLADARAKAEEIRAVLGRGGDPFSETAERMAKRRPALFGEVVTEYIEAMKPKWRGGKTLSAWNLFSDVYAKPIQKIPVSAITTDDVVRAIRPIWETKHETARRVRDCIKIVLDHARARGLRSGDNPAVWKGHLDQILAKPDSVVRSHHAAIPYAEIPAFISRLRTATTTSARALEFLILTAARSAEARKAVWSEFDLDEKLWTVPAARMKAKKIHRVPLSSRAVQIIRDMKKISINDFVFTGEKSQTALSDMTMARAKDNNGGKDFTIHGFRSAFRDWAAEETDFQREVIEAALAHAVGDETERAYRRGDALEKRRKLMNAWADYCGSVKK